MSRHRRASLGEGFGYVPGEQPPDGAGWLKLNTNEAPLGPSPRVAPAMAAAATELRRYPDPRAEPLRSALAARHGVGPEQVIVGNGADQVIDCCFRAFCEPGDVVVWTDPSYSLFPVLARLFGVSGRSLACDAEGALPAALGSEPGVLRFVVNPNTPTGAWTPPEVLEELLAAAPGVVVIDEAYCDFAPASCLPLLARHPAWLVLRSFSKAHALAGLRVGYALGAADLVADLEAVKDSYPVDRAAVAGALAALEDEAHHRRIVATVVAERERLAARLRGAGFEVAPSRANFLLVRPPGGAATEVAERLRGERILVRRLRDHPEHLRVTVGAPEENDRLLAALGG